MKFKKGDKVKWENAVSSFYGVIVDIKVKKRPPDYCNECGQITKKNGKKMTIIYIKYKNNLDRDLIYPQDMRDLNNPYIKLIKV